jgi:hypothetical protein
MELLPKRMFIKKTLPLVSFVGFDSKWPTLLQVVGCSDLDTQIRQVKSVLHVFGIDQMFHQNWAL